jgi:hypothetical protein
VPEDESTDGLVQTLLRWSVDEASSAELVNEATRMVADGDVAEWVMALACLPPDASAIDVENALDVTPPEVGFSVVPRGNAEAVFAAALAMVRRCVRGQLAERDLARWMHAVVGHDCSEDLEPLVVLDDVYDTIEYTSYTNESVDARVRSEADRLDRLHPST